MLRSVHVRHRRDDRGATAVEFALVLMPLLLIVFALIQYGMYFYSAQTGSNTVNAAARQLSVGNCDTDPELKAFVDNRLGAAASGASTVARTYYDVDGSTKLVDQSAANAKIGGVVKLQVDFPAADFNFPFVPFMDDPVVSRTVTARVEDTTDQGCGA